MKQLFFLLYCAVVCSSVLFARAPAPRQDFYKPGWDAPVDPDKDCKFTQTKAMLTIEVPGKDHDLDPGRKMNAPRLVRNVEGDFRAEVRVSCDWPLSTNSTVPGKPAVAAGGLVFLSEQKGLEVLRLEFGRTREFKEYEGYKGHFAFRINGAGHFFQLPKADGWPLAAGALAAH